MSILFKPEHLLHRQGFGIVVGHQWFISFVTRGELLLWPKVNQWGSTRREEADYRDFEHLDGLTLIPVAP